MTVTTAIGWRIFAVGDGDALVVRNAHVRTAMPTTRGTLVAFPGWSNHEVEPVDAGGAVVAVRERLGCAAAMTEATSLARGLDVASVTTEASCHHQVVAEELEQFNKAVVVNWSGVDRVPIYSGTQFLVQIDASSQGPDQVVLSVGQVTPPPLLGSRDEKLTQLSKIN